MRSGCPAWRHADDDDYRAKADQEVEAGPLPDSGRRRDDGADHQIYPPDGVVRQYPQPGARGVSSGRRGKARRGAYRTAGGYRRRTARQPAAEAQRSEEHTTELQSLMRTSYAV